MGYWHYHYLMRIYRYFIITIKIKDVKVLISVKPLLSKIVHFKKLIL
jgi:hypothetical protein